MKKYLFYALVGLLAFAGYSLAQTDNSTSAVTNAPTVAQTITSASAVTNAPIMIKCGVNSFSVSNDCGMNVFKNVYFQCYDGYEERQGGDSSCKSSEVWQEYAKTACANHCNNTRVPVATTPVEPLPTIKASEPVSTPVCNGGDLTKQYNTLILELQKVESTDDQTRTKEITDQIIALKQQIAASENKCQIGGGGSGTASGSVPPTILVPQPITPPIINRCGEVNQWQEKINYYQKLSGLSDDDLAKETSSSREEIKNTLSELQAGIEKVKNQCSLQVQGVQSTAVSETVKPVAADSGQEIDVYYKAQIEKITTLDNTQVQIQKLKALRGEIDGLIEKLIQGRKEVEIGELNNLVNKVTVSAGEIKVDEVAVKTTDKKILINIGNTAVSVESTQNNVLIKDNGLEVNTVGVSIKENVMSVGDAEVKMAASDVAQKLNISPSSVELKAEDQQAVYEMKTSEKRKLLGFINFNFQKTVTANAQNGDILKEQLPWYAFLTTK